MHSDASVSRAISNQAPVLPSPSAELQDFESNRCPDLDWRLRLAGFLPFQALSALSEIYDPWPYTKISSTKFLIPSIQCALPVTTIMDIWQLQHMGTGCTVTHLRFHNRVTKAGQLQAPRDTFIDKMSVNKALLKVNSSRLQRTNKVNIYRNKHNYTKTVKNGPTHAVPNLA